MKPGLTGLALALLASATRAETDFTALTDAERAAFHDEIRAVLLAHPELVRPKPPTPTYEDEIAGDLALIAANAKALFAPNLPGFGPETASNRIALVTTPDCRACARALTDLEKLSQSYELRVYVIDAAQEPELAQKLGVDTLPFYVLPKMMLRGHVPPVVLDRYLASGTGQ